MIPLAELLEEAAAAAPSVSVGSQPTPAAAAAQPGVEDGDSSEEDDDECGAAGSGSAMREAVSFQVGFGLVAIILSFWIPCGSPMLNKLLCYCCCCCVPPVAKQPCQILKSDWSGAAVP